MLPLRFPWIWMALGWTLVAGVVIGSLLPGVALTAFVIEDKLVHAGSYCLLMLWFGGLYERRRHGVIALGLVLLGLGLDVLQGNIATRTFDWLDVLADTLGVALGLALSLGLLGGWCLRLERLLA